MATNDFDDYADLHDGVTGDTIRAAADDPNQNANVIAALASELAEDEQHVAGDIEGDIEAGTRTNPAQVQQDASQLAQAGYYAVGLLKQYAASVDTFDEGVEELNRRLRSDVASARRYLGGVPEEDRPEYDETWNNIRANLEPEYRDLNTAVDESAEDIAGKFEAGPTPENVKELVLAGLIPFSVASRQWPDLTFTDDERRQALENEVANMSAEEQAQWVRDNTDIGADIVDVISDEAQELLAEDVIDDIENEENIDTETVRLLDLFKEEEAFTTKLYDEVSFEDLSDAIRHLSIESVAGVTNSGDESFRSNVELYNGFMNAAGVAMATYSNNVSSPTALATRFYDAITTDNREDYHQASALTLLLREGGEQAAGVYDATFMDKLATDVLAWERSHDGDPVWGPRDYAGIMDPDVSWNDETGMFHGRSAADGLANLLGAMGNSPEAAQAFFQDDSGETDSDILDYLIGTKDGDDVNARTFSASVGSDEGDGLGEALEAAAVRNADDPGSHEWSGEFATDVFNRVADLSGHGDKWGPDDVWHIWPNTADNLGNIAASYAPDVYDIIDGPGGQHLNVESGDLDKVLGEIGRGDKSGIETLTTAIVLEGNNRLDQEIQEWIEDNPGQPVDIDQIISENLGRDLEGISGTNGEILGHVINKAITVDEHDQSLAETRAAYASKAIDVVGGFVPGGGKVLGEGASHLATSAFDVTKGQGLAVLKDAVNGTPSATGGDWHDAARSDSDAVLEHQITTQLINSGVLSVGDTSDEDFNADAQIPESLTITNDDGSVSLNPDVFGPTGPDTSGQIGEDGEYTEAQQDQMREDMRTWMGSSARNYNEIIAQSAQNGLDRELNKK
ncbi:hypothetical protein [Aeromicrobium sp. CTD01-1L150]|uniref:hypothetical protein n=1 Tax=Aeromicrobium sp. CTD01-1L150 TaxID=3341830 RepID=UPI0035C262A8